MRIGLAMLHLVDPLWLFVIEVLLHHRMSSCPGIQVRHILHLLEMNTIVKMKAIKSISIVKLIG